MLSHRICIKKKIIVFFLLTLIFFYIPGNAAQASKAYITDQFRISLRRGPTIENKILRFLPSGSPVMIVQDTDQGWSEVRTLSPDQKQIEGWVLSRYLIHRQPFKHQTEALKEKNNELQQQLTKAYKTIKENKKTISALSGNLNNTEEKLKKTEQKYNTLKQDSDNLFKLQQNLKKLQAKHGQTLLEKKQIKEKRYHQWMGVGALILIGGFIAGLIGGKKEKKVKRRGYL
ncbi:MAG: TIGR04211 family SH3 domain-containing protein [Thermodesulfobacteriota bacterium]